MQNEKLRNVAIIAHVDHGKTTLVDEMLKQGGVYRENQEVVDRVMDSNDLERERGFNFSVESRCCKYTYLACSLFLSKILAGNSVRSNSVASSSG